MDKMLVAGFLEEQTSTETYETCNPLMQNTMVDRLGRLCSRLKSRWLSENKSLAVSKAMQSRDKDPLSQRFAGRSIAHPRRKHSFNKRRQRQVIKIRRKDAKAHLRLKTRPSRGTSRTPPHDLAEAARDHTLQNKKKGTRSHSSFQSRSVAKQRSREHHQSSYFRHPSLAKTYVLHLFTVNQDLPEKHGQPKRDRAASTRYQPTSANDQRSRGYFDKPSRASASVVPKILRRVALIHGHGNQPTLGNEATAQQPG